MIGEHKTRRGQLKGYIFELVVRKWLEINEFTPLPDLYQCDVIRQNRDYFTEFRGRGCWHQIDIPCDYKNIIPFINPIRILVEVKFLSSKVGKGQIREFIGVLKDITENYVVSPGVNWSATNNMQRLRYTELGVFFSASGFNNEAESLAYAHNIKTISYQNNPLVDRIVNHIMLIEEEDLEASVCLARGNFDEFRSILNSVLYDESNPQQLTERFKAKETIVDHISQIKSSINAIKSVFFGSTQEGVLLQFFSEYDFPEDLFIEVDTQLCEVYYSTDESGNSSFYMVFSEDREKHKYYFIPPESLRISIYNDYRGTLSQKSMYFKHVTIIKTIHGRKRIVALQLNRSWLECAFNDS